MSKYKSQEIMNSRTLHIGDLDPTFDENYIASLFRSTSTFLLLYLTNLFRWCS